MSELYKVDWSELINDCKDLAKKIGSCDSIVALGRGGLVPGVILSHMLDTNLVNFGVKSYNKNNTAGEVRAHQTPGLVFNSDYREKRVVIFDDLSDKGNTLEYVKDYFDQCGFLNYKFATLYIKKSTKFTPNYFVKEFDDNIWLDFPWESSKLD
jgi:hypoxanthine phosphoribosyltransferase